MHSSFNSLSNPPAAVNSQDRETYRNLKSGRPLSPADSMDDRLWSNLPPEILIDILPSLPVKSLCRFKCVSPSWKTLISSPHFVQTHLGRTMANNPPPSYKAILLSSSKDLYSVDFADANPTLKMLNLPSRLFKEMGNWTMTKSLSSCNGLVLVSDGCNFNLLLNPCTSEYKNLPGPYPRYSSDDLFYGPVLGYDPHTNNYKVVSLVWRLIDFDDNNNHDKIVHAAVYSLKANAWRAIQDFPSDHFVEGRGGVCFNERLHWLCRRTADVNFSQVIVTFTLADEIFGEVGLPALGNHHECRGDNMVVLGGCLCLLVSSERDRIDVWMMMEYGVRESWTKFSTAYPGCSIRDVLCLSAQDDLVLGRKDLDCSRRVREILRGRRRVIDEFEGDKLVMYNPVKGTRRDLVVHGIPPRSLVGYHYIETLVSPNHAGQFSETM